MALCFELESCYPDINPSIFTDTNLSEFVGQYISICEACYLVKQAQVTNCTATVDIPVTSYTTCSECYNTTAQGICGSCPEYYSLITLDNGTQVCQKEGSYPAEWSGERATVEAGDRATSYGNLGLNLLENVTNATWPIVGYKISNFSAQTCPPLQLDPAMDGPGFWSNWGFKDNWGNGSIIFGQLGYSVYDSFAPTPTQAKTSATDLNGLFRSNSTTTQGRLNTAGIWATSGSTELTCSGITQEIPDAGSTLQEFIQGNSLQCDNSSATTSYIRYDFCFNVTVEKEYLIGFAADNAVRVILDDQPFFALVGQGATFRKLGNCTNLIIEPAFNQWHVVPITFTPGVHTITLIGYNDFGTAANYAAEVYNLTSQELKDQFLNINLGSYAAAVAALEPKILFSTKNYIGNNSYSPVGEGEWTCLDGSAIDPCSQSGQPECGCVSNIPVPGCCYKLTKCGEPTIIYTNSDLSQYQGQTVTINNPSDPTACYLVEQLTENCPEGAIEVTVTESYTSCETCAPSYKLYNCKDLNVTVQTGDISFAQYLGKTVKLTQYPGDCWQVGPNNEKTTPLEQLTVNGLPFANCEECNPKSYFLTNCVNGVSVISTADLSTYVGKVIKSDSFPGLCFTVSDSLCNCLSVTLNGLSYEVNKEFNLFNGKPYFQFTTINNIPIVVAYNSSENRWEVYNPDTQNVYFYSSLDIDCPATSLWVKLDPTFPGNITTETCPLSILNIEPSQEFVSCEPCVKC